MDLHRGTDRALTPALELRDVDVRFGAVNALAGASFAASPGTVHALLGENGAGKTTLMRVAFGSIRPAGGTISVDGRHVRFGSPSDALRAGIGMVHQHFTLVPAMTVAENVSLGLRSEGWRYDRRRAAARVREIGRETGLELPPEALVSSLAVAAQQRLEIIKALARDAHILVLDEPTAVLSPLESEDLLRWLRRLADDGRTVVLITHKLRDALAIADDVTVLRQGRTVLERPARGVTSSHLADAMLGGGSDSAPRAIPEIARPAGATRSMIIAQQLRVHDERGTLRVRDASFELQAGEIIGIAAVEGSGHRELLRALARRLPVSRGTLELPPSIGYVPEDRQHDALALDLSLTENIALRGAGGRRGRIRWKEVARRTSWLMETHDVRAERPGVPVRTLSGGNQQKLVLARELDGDPEALIIENPTRGLDLRASAAVHDHLRAAAHAGTTVVMHSSDVDETLALASRVLVVYDRAVREVPRDRSVIGAVMLGSRDE